MQEQIKGIWDLKVSIPIPTDIERISVRHLNGWVLFKDNLVGATEFKSGVAEWCDKIQRLVLTKVALERDCYRQHIEAKNPNKRIRIVAGTVQVQGQ